MKPFLCMDVTESNESPNILGEEFIVSRVLADTYIPPEERKKLKSPETIKSYLPLYLRIIRFICGLFSIAFVLFVFRVYMKRDGGAYLGAYWQHHTWIFWLGGLFIVAWLALNIVDGVLESKATRLREKEIEESMAEETDELNIPDEAQNLDILVFNYRTENGELVPVAQEDAISAYLNYSMNIFADRTHLYIASLDEKYAIERSSLRAIRTIDESIAVPDWNKDAAPTQGIYKQYKLSVDNLDRINIPKYHVLEFFYEGETWGIYFPCYELSAIEALTGLKAE